MSAELDIAYAEAVYRFACRGDEFAFMFRGRERGMKSLRSVLGDGCCWAIITAHNPRSRALSEADNAERHLTLARELVQRNLEHWPSESSDPAGGHREPGFLIVGITREVALELARRFDQHALVFGRGPDAGLLNTWTEQWSRL